MMFRRTKAVRLLEETPIRWQFWQVVLEKLKQIARRMEDIQKQLADPGYSGRQRANCGIAPRIAPPGPAHFGNAADLAAAAG